MDPIDNVQRALALLRKQLVDKAANQKAAGDTDPTAQQTVPTASAAPQGARQLAARRIRALRLSDPLYQDKAVSAFVESILAEEFGESAVNTPDFQDMVRHVSQQMMAESSLAKDLRTLVEQLRSAG